MEDKPSHNHPVPTEDAICVVPQESAGSHVENTPGSHLKLDDCSQSYAQVYGWDKPHRSFSRDDVRSILISVQDLGLGSHGVVDEVKLARNDFSSFVRKRVILRPGQKSQRKKRTIEQEARILSSLNHPHIVTYIGTFDEWEKGAQVGYALLMTPVGDGDLNAFFEATQDGRYSEKLLWIWKWFGCLASALKYIHKQNVRHEDIKPSNIIHRGPNIFFTDFSSAGSWEVDDRSSTESPSRCTARYAAPEVENNLTPDEKPTRHGTKSDVFSLACVYLEMLTVLTGRSVDSLHEFCTLQARETQEPYFRSRPIHFKYHQVADCIGDWFSDKAIQRELRDLYDDILEPMLHPIRENRPDAGTVHFQLRSLDNQQFPCDCTRQVHQQPRRPGSSSEESTTSRRLGTSMATTGTELILLGISCISPLDMYIPGAVHPTSDELSLLAIPGKSCRIWEC